MADQPKAGDDRPDRRAELLARREQQRRALRRRRMLAAIGLALGFAAAIAIVAGLLGTLASDDSHPTASGRSSSRIAVGTTTSTRKGGGNADDTGGSVRNATPRPDWEAHTGPVPILEYHVLGSPDAEAPYPELYVARPDFRREMDWLDENGFEAVTLEQTQDAWYRGGTLPPKPVVLSFDDGYRPQFTFALPELRSHGWAGVLNLKAEGSDLYQSNVEAMIDAGWELASHTTHHLDLTTLDPEQLKDELDGSRRILHREYGVPVRNFCYPAGRYDEAVIAAVEAAGYAGATTEVPGYASREHPYELDRFEVLGSSGVSGVAEAVSSG